MHLANSHRADMSLSKEQLEEIENLANQIRDLGNQLVYLREQSVLETNPSKIFANKNSVLDIREQMNQIGYRRDELIRLNYCSSMLSINYSDQVDPVYMHFDDQKQTCGAFLICGPLKFGQLWAYKNTINQISATRTRPSCDFHFENPNQGKDPDQIWDSMGEQLNLLGAKTQPNVTKVVLGRLETQHVTFLFRHIQSLSEQQLIGLIEQVWKPLVERVGQEKKLENSTHKLAAFFLDYSGDTCQWSLPCVPPGSAPPQPAYYPIRLNTLSRFKLEDLNDWAKTDKTLGVKIKADPKIAENLLVYSDNGVPERVADGLLKLFGLTYKGEDLWLDL
jgi:hypothetical protein